MDIMLAGHQVAAVIISRTMSIEEYFIVALMSAQVFKLILQLTPTV
jgi:hypothetical protein